MLARNNSEKEKGECYKTIEINNGDVIDIISTNKSVYGYFSVSGGFKIDKVWNSYSTTTRANVGPNNGCKLINGQQHNNDIFNSQYEFLKNYKILYRKNNCYLLKSND